MRELRNAIARSVVLCAGARIRVADLPPSILEQAEDRTQFVRLGLRPQHTHPTNIPDDDAGQGGPRTWRQPAITLQSRVAEAVNDGGLRERLKLVEREIICDALMATGGNHTAAAQAARSAAAHLHAPR